MKKKLALGIGIILLSISMIVNSSMMNFMSKADSSVNVLFDPEQKSVSLNEIFNISLRISNVDDLVRWQLGLQWNSSVVEPASSKAIVEGSFLSDFGSTTFQCPAYNMGSGTISPISCAFNRISVPPLPRAHGSGILLNITFKVVGYGEADISAIGCVLTQSTSKKIYVTSPGNAHVSVNLVVKNIAVSWDSACAPRDVFAYEEALVGAIVSNTGTEDATNFRVSFLMNGTLMRPPSSINVTAGSSCNLSIVWSSPIEGNCTIAVRADSLPGETNTEDNCVSAKVAVLPRVHDVAVSLGCPSELKVGQTALLNLTVVNLGAFDETNVDLTLTIKGGGDDSEYTFSVPVLNHSRSYTLNYSWTPGYADTYDISLRASPLIDEISLTNNRQSRIVSVMQDNKAGILIVSDSGGVYSRHGTSLKEFKSALDNARISYDVWFEAYGSINGSLVNGSILDNYSLVIWTCGDYINYVIDPYYEVQLLLDYNQKGGNVLLEGEGVVPSLMALDRYELMQDMLCVEFKEPAPSVTGIEPTSLGLKRQHMIVKGLDSYTTWAEAPSWGLIGLKPIGKGFAVMKYIGTEDAAVTVVDGSESGKGSVVYCSFSLFSLPDECRDKLVQNTVTWFNRSGISTVIGHVFLASPNSVSFVYDGSVEKAGSDFSVVAGSMFYALCENEQTQLFADDLSTYEFSNSLVCIFGGVSNKVFQKYDASEMLPIKIWQNGRDPNNYVLMENGNTPVYEFEINPGKNSTFIIQVFTQKYSNTTYLVVWGADSKGMWAAGICLSMIVARDLRDYAGKYCVFRWTDADGNSIPKQEEITEILYGSG